MQAGLNFIDGRPRESGETIAVRNPASDKPAGMAAAATREQAEEAVRAAVRAAGDWGAHNGRPLLMAKAADVIDEHQEELARLLTLEQGKPLTEARGEIGRASLWLRHYADASVDAELVRDDAGRRVEIMRRP
ncbi:MAG: aldehyde dehydrogenase family protein, partial [Rhizobiaceae bacterium]|nr:aldehyde dehydrogenase family protein [Rhizobiaceae bacterium]